MLSCFWQSIKHNLQYDRVCKSFRSLFFIAYSRGVKAKWLYSPNVTTLWEYFLRNLKSLILCYYFMRMLFVRDFSKCLSAVYHLLERDSRKIESCWIFSRMQSPFNTWRKIGHFKVGCNKRFSLVKENEGFFYEQV